MDVRVILQGSGVWFGCVGAVVSLCIGLDCESVGNGC